MTALVDKFANQLDWNLLRTFMVIVQERSITLAAHRLSVTQLLGQRGPAAWKSGWTAG